MLAPTATQPTPTHAAARRSRYGVAMTHFPPPQQKTPPAGWYMNQWGQQQWWDGQQWGLVAQSPTPASNGIAVAGLIFGIISTLTIPLSIFIRHGWMLTYTIGFIPLVLGITLSWIGVYRGRRTRTNEKIAATGLALSAISACFPLLMVL